MSRAPLTEPQAEEALAAVVDHVGTGPRLAAETGWEHDGYVIFHDAATDDTWVDGVDWPDGVTVESITFTAVALLPAPFEEGCPDCSQETLVTVEPDPDDEQEPDGDVTLRCTSCGWVSQ